MPAQQNTYGISELAQEFGVTPRTIRHYEDIGLLSPGRKGQTRLYSAADRTKLKLILRGKRLGLSLQESQEIIDMYDPKQGSVSQLQRFLATINRQRSRLERQLEDIQTMMKDLDEAEQGCLRALQPKTRPQRGTPPTA
ncbi:MAG: MerR family transcriptional regulator [Porticoccaceae bacterium]